jgi:acyl carrier protein
MNTMSPTIASAETWLRNWLGQRSPGLVIGPDDNYFDKAGIDSFEAIVLIEEAEQAFSIRFRQTDFQERRFATIAGFGQIVAERQHSPG